MLDRATSRTLRTGAALGAAGFAALAVVLVRLAEVWRVGPHAPAHTVDVLGQRLAYPAANLDAMAVLALAALAIVAIGRAGAQAGRELAAARRLRTGLEQRRRAELGGAVVVDAARPLAFCAGLLRPRVYVSTATLTRLDPRALEAVLAHERHHVRRRDPLRLAAARVAAHGLFFVPGLRALAARGAELTELSADRYASGHGPEATAALARAILSFDAAGQSAAPARVDALLGEARAIAFPLGLCALAALVITAVGAATLLLARAATGSATLAPPILSSQPCMVTLAALPGAGLLLARRVRLPRRAASPSPAAPGR